MVCAFVYKNCWGGQTALERAKEQLRKGAPEWMPRWSIKVILLVIGIRVS